MFSLYCYVAADSVFGSWSCSGWRCLCHRRHSLQSICQGKTFTDVGLMLAYRLRCWANNQLKCKKWEIPYISMSKLIFCIELFKIFYCRVTIFSYLLMANTLRKSHNTNINFGEDVHQFSTDPFRMSYF